MAEKTGVEPTLKQVISSPKKRSGVSKVSSKAKSRTELIPAKDPVLFYSHIILSDELRTFIDEKWKDCWPVNTLRPIVLLDLISYLLFIKKLEEKHLIAGNPTQLFSSNLASSNEPGWNSSKDINAQNLLNLFMHEENIPELIKNYGLTNLQYSQFLKEPLLLTPTPRLLFNMVEIVKLMNAEANDTKAAIFEYLLNKAETESGHGQVFKTDKIVELIIELMRPEQKDIIWDPSAGEAGFLVNGARYTRIKNSKNSKNSNNVFFGENYKGIECDPIRLRIGAMNMLIHGIEDPKLEGIAAFEIANSGSCEQPTLVLSNLFFEGVKGKDPAEEKAMLKVTDRPEICFLNLILKKLIKGVRGAVIVPEYILYNNTTEIKSIRQQIVDDHKLAAVISLTGKGGSLSSPGILIFSEPKAGISNKVWFYKMKPGIKKNESGSTDAKVHIAESMEENYEMAYIISEWRNETKENTGTENSFYLLIDEIKANNYNLYFNEYRKIEKVSQPYTSDKIAITNKEIINPHSTPKKINPGIGKIKLRLHSEMRKFSSAFVLLIKSCGRLNPRVKKFSLTLVSFIIIIYLVVIAFNFIISKIKNENALTVKIKNNNPHGTNKPKEAIGKLLVTNATPAKLSPEQIKAIIYDTTAINHFDEHPVDASTSLEDSVNNFLQDEQSDILTNKTPNKNHKPGIIENTLSVKYIVIDTTFFHNQPYEGSAGKTYLDPLNNDILNPIDDKNGFIYVVYTNQSGNTSKGWINKKDLMSLR